MRLSRSPHLTFFLYTKKKKNHWPQRVITIHAGVWVVVRAETVFHKTRSTRIKPLQCAQVRVYRCGQTCFSILPLTWTGYFLGGCLVACACIARSKHPTKESREYHPYGIWLVGWRRVVCVFLYYKTCVYMKNIPY